MNFERFKSEWFDSMWVDETLTTEYLDEQLHEFYIEYKESLTTYGIGFSVKQWCDFFFADFDIETHGYMTKTKEKQQANRN